MKRIPSIHISQDNLHKILKEVIRLDVSTDELVELVLIKAKKYSLTNRKLLASNQKTTKKANKLLSSNLEDSTKMNQAILMVRKSLKHRGIHPIDAGSRDYSMLKTIAGNGREFYDTYCEPDEDIFQAFVTYIKLACTKMVKFSLPKLTSMHTSLMEHYEANLSLKDDPNPGLTERIYKAYNYQIVSQVGSVMTDYSKIPEKYLYFMKAGQLALKHKISPENYIDAQFKGLAWCNGIPDPSQLVNNKAMEYLQKYLFENPDARAKNVSSEERVNKFKDILNLK